MAATFRSVGSSGTGAGTATSFSPTMPAGFVAGDLLIGIACNGAGEVPATRPSGSTGVINVDDGTVFNMDVVYKVAAGGDVFTWTSVAANKWVGCVIAITTGTFNTSTPVQGAVQVVLGTTAGTTVTTPSSTPGNNDSLMIAAFGAQSTGTWTCNQSSPTMLEAADLSSSGTGNVSMGAYRASGAAPVSAITRTGTTTVSTANGGGMLFYINPAGAVTVRPGRPRTQHRPAVARAANW